MNSVTEVRVGQVWADNDHRYLGRQVEILSIDGGVATVKVVAHPKSQRMIGKKSKIRAVRFLRARNSGYTIVATAPKPVPAAPTQPERQVQAT